MNNHSTVQKLLTAYALGELNQQDTLQVEAHLAECDSCRNELAQMQAVLNIADSIKTQTAPEQTHTFATQEIQAIPGRTKTEESKKISWSKIMNSKITKSAAAAIILVGAFIFLTQLNGISPAFADVMQKLAATKSAAFDLTIEFGEQEPQTSVFLYDSNGYIRQNMANGTVNIVNYNEMKVLSLEPETMTAVLRDVNNESFHSALYEIFINFHAMVDEAINLGKGKVLSLPSTTIENHKVYGFQIDTVGQKPGLFWQGKGTLKIWADAETDFPIEVQWYSDMTNMKVTVSNIQLNQYIDPAQFNMEIPEGYNLPAPTEPAPLITEPNEITTQNWTPNDIEKLVDGLNKDEKKLIEFFNSWAILTKGRFPSSLTVDAIKDIDPDAEISFKQKLWSYSFSASLPNVFKDCMPLPDCNSLTEEQMRQINKQMDEHEGPYYEEFKQNFRNKFGCEIEEWGKYFDDIIEGFKVVIAMPAKSDWHYNGAGVELGDSETAIFWYLPEGSENYRAIFGDLTIEDVTPEDIPLLETSIEEDQTDQMAEEVLETAIQLGADIPKDKRPIVLRMLTLKEKDLIKGLAVWLELLDGKYPNSLEGEAAIKQSEPLLVAKYYEGKQVIQGKEAELKEKTYDLFFASAFYDKLTNEKKEPAYYGDKITVQDSNKILVRWKIKKDRYRVVLGNLTSKTVTAEELAKLEKQSKD